MVMTAKETDKPGSDDNLVLVAARTLLHRGDDGGVPINRNDVGYNKVDYGQVKALLGRFERDGRASSVWLIYLLNILRKYRRQLGEMGFDPEALANAAGQEWVGTPVARGAVAPPDALDAVLDADESPEPDAPVIPPMRDVLGPEGVIARRLDGYESRPGQIELAQAVADAIQAEESILGEAGTGVGKSLAYLAPAIYSGKTTIVSTEGKALQDQLAGKDLPFLASVLAVPFRFAVLKGLSNYVCNLKWDEEANGLGLLPGVAELKAWRDTTPTGDLAEAPTKVLPELRAAITTTTDDCLGQQCGYADRCFVLQARKRAKDAQVVVVNHTLLCLDLALREQTDDGVSILPDRDLVVVDEAHALEDVATDAFSEELSESAVPLALRGKLARLADLDDDEIARTKTLNDEFFGIVGRDQRLTYRIEPSEDLRLKAGNIAGLLRGMARQARQMILDQGDYDAGLGGMPTAAAQLIPKRIQGATPAERQANVRRELYARRLESLADRFGTCTESLDTHVTFVEKTRDRRDQQRVTLKRAPISVADDLASALWAKWPVVATSATLTTGSGFAFFRERTGCDNAREITVESPFDYARNALLYLPPNGASFDPSRFYQDGSVEYFSRLADEIERLLLASDGRAFCLFTSRRAMDEVYQRLDSRLRWTVLRQGDYGLAETIRRFKADGHAVLFGLRSYMTGVDVQGEALSLVIIDKLSFAPPDDPVFEARKDDLTRTSGDKWAWFNRLAVPTATIILKQAAGRLIRGTSDRGAIALLDGRLTQKSYGGGILRSLPPATQTRSLDAVKTFFAARS